MGQIVATQIAVGIGGGMLNVPAQLGVQASCDHQHVAVATAVYLTCVEIGGAVGSAISGAVWGHDIPRKLTEYLPYESKDQAMAIYNSIDVARSYPVGHPTRNAIDRAYQETMSSLLIIAVCVAVPCVLASLAMDNYKLDSMDQGVKGRIIGGNVEYGSELVADGVKEEHVKRNKLKDLGSWLRWPKPKKRNVFASEMDPSIVVR